MWTHDPKPANGRTRLVSRPWAPLHAHLGRPPSVPSPRRWSSGYGVPLSRPSSSRPRLRSRITPRALWPPPLPLSPLPPEDWETLARSIWPPSTQAAHGVTSSSWVSSPELSALHRPLPPVNPASFPASSLIRLYFRTVYILYFINFFKFFMFWVVLGFENLGA